jgi:hypothetical protein
MTQRAGKGFEAKSPIDLILAGYLGSFAICSKNFTLA